MKVSVRISGRVTSISVRDSVCALHYTVHGGAGINVENHVLDACHSIVEEWEGDTGKGLSGFITDRLLEDLIDYPPDARLYREALQRLSK